MSKWMIIILFSLIALVSLYTTAESAEYRVSTGQTTMWSHIAHTDDGDRYSMQALDIRFGSFDFSIIEHQYHIQGERDFSTMSFGIIKHWRLERYGFFLDGGLGLRYAEKDRRIKWLMNKHLVADFSGAVGYEINEYLSVSLGLRHFSCPGSDTGMNLEEVSIIFKKEF